MRNFNILLDNKTRVEEIPRILYQKAILYQFGLKNEILAKGAFEEICMQFPNTRYANLSRIRLDGLNKTLKENASIQKAEHEFTHGRINKKDLKYNQYFINQRIEKCDCETSQVSRYPQQLSVYEQNNLTGHATTAQLFQNVPNPLSTNTQIDYYIPIDCFTANIIVCNALGEIVKIYDLSDKSGFGSVIFEKGDLSAGVYFYYLVADNLSVDTKQLTIVL